MVVLSVKMMTIMMMIVVVVQVVMGSHNDKADTYYIQQFNSP